MFQSCCEEVSRVVQESFKGISRKFQVCFKVVLQLVGVKGVCVESDVGGPFFRLREANISILRLILRLDHLVLFEGGFRVKHRCMPS